MNTKNILTSKYLWLNVIGFIVALVWQSDVDSGIMNDIANSTEVWLPVLNVINRFFTNKGVTLN